MKHYRTITFQPPASELSNFPLLVRIQNDPMASRIASRDGYDVRFEDSSGNSLPFDLDYYDAETRSGAWWVQIPSLPASESTTIRMSYGDSSITANQSSPLTVWADYGAVYHFNERTSDSQLNCADGVRSSAELGSSLSFQTSDTGSGRFLRCAYSGDADDRSQGIKTQMNLISPNYSVTMLCASFAVGTKAMWPYAFVPNYDCTDSLAYHNNVSLQVMASKQHRFYSGVYPHNSTALVSNTTDGMFLHGASLSQGVWRYTQIGTTFASGNSGEAVLFSDYTEFLSLVNAWAVDIQYDIDELRFCRTAHSQDWMLYEHENYMNHAANVTYGPEMNADGTEIRLFFPWIPMTKMAD